MTRRHGASLLYRVCAFAIAALGVAAQASAQITGATISTKQTSFSGACPATFDFTGAITGTPGTTFTYAFGRILYGTIEFTGDYPATMPASGSLAVADSTSITATSNDSEQVWVRNIAGGQSNVYSPSVNYSVTCKFQPGVLPPGAHGVDLSVKLHPQWTGLREYEYKWVGLSGFLPERGTGPCPELCIGWMHVHNGDSFWLFHWNTFDRAFVGYDPAAFSGLKVSKATLNLGIAGGNRGCFGKVGRAVLTKIPIAKGATQTFQAPYPSDGDFNWSTPTQFSQTFATVDVTDIVKGWVAGKMPNQGFVIRSKLEDNGSNGNDFCSLGFAADAVLSIQTLLK